MNSITEGLPQPLPPTFKLSASGELTRRPIAFAVPNDWVEIWICKPVPAGSFGLSATQRRKLRDLAVENGISYATGKTGRPGWNVRKSYPERDASARCPFLACHVQDGGTAIVQYRYTGSQRRASV